MTRSAIRPTIKKYIHHLRAGLYAGLLCAALAGLWMSVQAQDGTIPLPGTARETPVYQTLTSSAPGFGQQVALDGDWLVTSTYANDLLIYHRDSSGQYVTHSTIAVEEYDGYLSNAPTFGLENNRLFVGRKNRKDYEPGEVLVYEPNDTNVWTIVTTIHPTEPPEVYNTWFGSWLVIDKSGDQFVSDGLAYRRGTDGLWVPAGEILGAYSGSFISGDRLITAFQGDKEIYGTTVRFYQYTGGQYWDSAGSLYQSNPFGASAIIDGNTAFAGGFDDTSNFVQVMNYNGSEWEFGQTIRPISPSGEDSDNFGFRMVVDGDQMVITRLSDTAGFSSLYLYHRTGNLWSLVGEIDLPGFGYEFFGYGNSDIEAGVVAVGDIGYSFDNMGNESFAPKIYIFSDDDFTPPPVTPDVTPDVSQ